MRQISNIQLFALIVTFEIGSTTLFALGVGAKRDAWIVVLLSFLLSFILLWVYTEIPKYYPKQNFAEILNDCLGFMLAKPLLFLYSMYFLGQATHNFYEFGALIKMTALPNTPLLVILFMFIVVMVYILHKGIEVISRSIEIFLPYLFFFLLAAYFLNMISGDFEIANLLPILGEGFQPVLTEIPNIVAFPFGEMVVFLVIWHYVQKQHLIRKTTYIAVTVSTFLLLIAQIVFIAVLGVELTDSSEIPLLETMLSVHIAMIFTNLDIIGVFIMFIGGFYKTAIHFYGFSLMFTWLFNKSNSKWIIIIFGLALPIISILRFDNLDDQKWKGMEGGVYNILLYALLPLLILLIIKVKKKHNQ
ncbi:GerAB/ArcD/ProY family transporter [Gracilibacillus salitolerans]|uniref:GerAB/ArcD/ProY family transporter n=1 Tax=Gracilibacillus salitolerans TaxID=2663022 RepID=A0A5Q2TFC6_9BACI|nr:GerAB/ArcD/ProY family transporter [Gracilibacillus salitolerans]QGH33356.1 GerAB/ArcD/ProY family transporter [Gracilibacillus salitolerans]